MRLTTPLSAAIALATSLVLFSGEVRAQFNTPRSVEDIEIPAARPVPKEDPAAEDLPAEPAEPAEEPSADEVYIPGRTDDESLRRKEREEEERRQAAERAAGLASQSAADAGTAEASAQAGEAPREVQPVVFPPKDGDAQLLAAWNERQKAVRTRSFDTVHELERRIAGLREDLGYENLFALSAALTLEARQLLQEDAGEALRRAIFAAELSPDFPFAHWTIAQAAMRDDVTNVGRYAGSVVDAVKASAREPRWRSAVAGDLLAGALMAALLAGLVALVLIFARHARYFFHDFHHLLPAGTWRGQSVLLAGVGLLLPAAFGFGPFGVFCAMGAATWLYARRSERVLLGLVLVLVGLAPAASRLVAARSTFAGTRAEAVYLAERGGLEGSGAAAALKAMGEQGTPSFQVAFALGRQARRRGEMEVAAQWLRRAAELRPASAAALVELGNAQFLAGDLEGASETYQRAIDRQPDLAEPHFNLARLHARRSQMVPTEEASVELSRSKEAIRRTIDLDPRLGLLAAEGLDLRSNRLVTGAPLHPEALAEMAAAEASLTRIEEHTSRLLFGKIPRSLAPVLALLAVAALALFGLARARLAPSGCCTKCGRPVCRRCNPEITGPTLCGQCLTVFNQRSAVDPAARVAKEFGIRRFQHQRDLVVRGASLVATGAGQVLLGQPVRGTIYLMLLGLLVQQIVFPSGMFPTPAGAAPALLRVVPAALAVVLLHLLAARQAFKAVRGLPAPKE